MSHPPKVVLADLTEMVFEDREKAYGAYALRRSYRKNLLTGLAISSGFALALSFFSSMAGAGASPGDDTRVVVMELESLAPPPIDEDAKELPPPPPPPPPAAPKVQQLEFLPPDPTPEELVSDTATMHEIDDLKLIQNFGTDDVTEGDIDPYAIVFDQGDSDVPEVIDCGSCDDDPKPGEFRWVDEEPKPVNMEEISRQIVFPQILRDGNFQGTVVMRVLVDTRGQYLRHKVINSPHPLFTEEVERHIKGLQFTPAIQGNNPVKFWVNIPFSFKLLK